MRAGLTRAILGPRPAGALALLTRPNRQSCRFVEPQGFHQVILLRQNQKTPPKRGFLVLAEKEGFEPSMGVKAHTPLAGERLQPLGHLSKIGRHNSTRLACSAS